MSEEEERENGNHIPVGTMQLLNMSIDSIFAVKSSSESILNLFKINLLVQFCQRSKALCVSQLLCQNQNSVPGSICRDEIPV